MKITVIGAGNVGATCANVCAQNELANEIYLVDNNVLLNIMDIYLNLIIHKSFYDNFLLNNFQYI